MDSVKLRRGSIVLGVVAVASLSACSKQLSKADAKNLLKDQAAAYAPRCAIHERDAEYDPIAETIQYGDRDWGKLADTLGFVRDVKCPAAGRCTAKLMLAPNCTDRLGGVMPRMSDCTFLAACGHVEIDVDSIVTEGSRAKIRYRVNPVVDDVAKSVLAPKPGGGWLGGMLKVTGDAPSTASATAVYTDDGKWILEK